MPLFVTQSFFRDPNVVSSLRKTEAGAWVPLGMSCPLERNPFITNSRKLISSAAVQYLQSNPGGMSLTSVCLCVCVCVCCRQTHSVCCCGACAVHQGFDGAVWPDLLLWDPEAFWTFSEMPSWCLPWLWWTQTGYSLFSSTHLSESKYIFQHGVSPSLCFSRCCRRRTLSSTVCLGERIERSFCFAFSSTFVLEESSVSTKTPSSPTSAPQRKSTETWSGGQHLTIFYLNTYCPTI